MTDPMPADLTPEKALDEIRALVVPRFGVDAPLRADVAAILARAAIAAMTPTPKEN